MPLSDEASLFIPYEVVEIGEKYVAVQKQGDDVVYMSPIDWTTRADAVLHCEDLNYLRDKTLQSVPRTTLWVAVDVAADGPDGVVVLERALKGSQEVFGWRMLNPATDEDNDDWVKAREMVRNAVEVIGQMELPFEEDDEEVETDGSNEEEGAREDADS